MEIKWDDKNIKSKRMQKKTIWKNKEQMKQIGKKSNKMTDLSSLSIITINANSLNTPNKSKRLSNWIKKKVGPNYMPHTRIPL